MENVIKAATKTGAFVVLWTISIFLAFFMLQLCISLLDTFQDLSSTLKVNN